MSDSPKIDDSYQGAMARSEPEPDIDGVVIQPVSHHVDDRQDLLVYLKESDPFFGGFAQSYIAVTDRGVVKAWHYHLAQTDIWFVPHGKIKVGLFDARADSKTCGVVKTVVMSETQPATLVIPPGVYHGYMTLSVHSILINTTNQPYDPGDEYRLSWDDARIDFDWGVKNR
ncbi:MAG: dTDP-4-dehydrorhamnose 3,5-epimerase family protein [Candidatus Latescibacteria bacterium]|nr:dTDP-4-dehydrorhamnose 3,5-epimerase family protein [Candidatus Latescibacterota bacterium]